jgi:hypothetical protein
MNIVRTSFATIEEDFDYFTPLEERYNGEMPPNLIVIKEWNYKSKKLMVDFN